MRTTRLTLLCAVLAAGCGGGMASAPNPPALTPASKVTSVVPSCANPLASGASEQCTAVVMGTGNLAVTWVASAASIPAAAISSSGLLTAAMVTAVTNVTVTATSVETPSVTGQTVVVINPPPPAPTSIVVSCTPASVLSNGTSQCSATVAPPTVSQAVTWGASNGSMTATGLYTAPNSTIVFTDTVVAFAPSKPSISGTFSITVTPPPPPPAASVTVQCPPSVNSGATAQCTAVVSPPGASQNVGWVTSLGTITQLGGLTAPTVTKDINIVVSATAVNTDVVGHATVDVLAPPPPPSSGPVNLGPGQIPVMRLDSNGNIDIAWISISGTAVLFTRSIDGGATFSAPVTVALAQPDQYLQMELDSAGDITLLWTSTPAGAINSFVSRSSDGGKTFTTNTVTGPNSVSPQLAVEPTGVIDVSWLDIFNSSLNVTRSTDGGVTFSKPLTVWTTTNDAVSIQAAIGPQGQLYVFWSHEIVNQCDILFTRSLDGAKTFSTPLDLSNSVGCSVNPFPVVDSGGSVNVAWHKDGNSVFFSRSADQGQTFSTPTSVFGTEIEVSSQNFVVDSNGKIDMVWDAATTDFDVLFAESADHGATFSTPVLLSLPPIANFTGGGDPVVAVDMGGKVSVAWSDDSNGTLSGDFDIYMKTSLDAGSTFSSASNLSQTKGQSEIFPQIIINPLRVRYLVWSQTSSSVEPNPNRSVFFDAVPE